jgi:hypothetical protein
LTKALVCILSATPAIFLNSLRADIFKFDPNYLENEEKYKAIKADILGEGSSDDESGSESDSEGDDEGVLGRLISYLLPY